MVCKICFIQEKMADCVKCGISCCVNCTVPGVVITKKPDGTQVYTIHDGVFICSECSPPSQGKLTPIKVV